MNRRAFLGTIAAALPFALSAAEGWRKFRITTRVEVLRPVGLTRLWVPASLLADTPYQRTLARTFECEGGAAKIVKEQRDSVAMLAAEFPAGIKPTLTLTNEVATTDRATDFSSTSKQPKLNSAEREHWLHSTKLLPTDGIVREKALAITASAKTDTAKARAIYEWIVENTYRKAETRGCGLGNIHYMLEANDLGGKCADLNALYVGLARASGLPARDIYGLRVAPSRLGYKSLGAASEKVSKAQHCRAEVFLNEYGWVAVDPADVRKVMLEEPPGNRPIGDERVQAARTRLFGSWEGNWIAYNYAHDVTLPGSAGPAIGFFMYPQAETSEGRLDSLAPDTFHYEIEAREIAS